MLCEHATLYGVGEDMSGTKEFTYSARLMSGHYSNRSSYRTCSLGSLFGFLILKASSFRMFWFPNKYLGTL